VDGQVTRKKSCSAGVRLAAARSSFLQIPPDEAETLKVTASKQHVGMKGTLQ
jgi:hypothetical protein